MPGRGNRQLLGVIVPAVALQITVPPATDEVAAGVGLHALLAAELLGAGGQRLEALRVGADQVAGCRVQEFSRGVAALFDRHVVNVDVHCGFTNPELRAALGRRPWG